MEKYFSGTMEMYCFGAIRGNDQKIILNFFPKEDANMEQYVLCNSNTIHMSTFYRIP